MKNKSQTSFWSPKGLGLHGFGGEGGESQEQEEEKEEEGRGEEDQGMESFILGFWYEFPWRIDAPWSRVLEEIT